MTATSKTVNDYTEHASGTLAGTDFLYLVRTGNTAGDRDRKLAASWFQPMHAKLTALSASVISGVAIDNSAIGGTTPAAGTFTSLTSTGAYTPTGGVAAAGGFAAPTVYPSGGMAPPTATTGTDTTPVVTESYIAEIFIPANCTLTGIAILNGSAVAGNMKLSLVSSAGAQLATTASTAQSGTAAYQKVPFTGTYAAKGPGKYFVHAQFNNTGARFRSHAVGVFGASKKTGEVYGTFTTITPPTTFTADLGPIASTY